MDLLPGALVVQQRMQELWRRNAPEYEVTPWPAPHCWAPRRAVRRGLGRMLIVVGTALVRWAEPVSGPSGASKPVQRA
jgi:hypothetical protein